MFLLRYAMRQFMLKKYLFISSKAILIGVIGLLVNIPQLVSAAGERLGGMNLNGYCASLGDGDSVLDGDAWSCTEGTTIVLDAACQWQYPGEEAVVRQTVLDNPYSWTCYNGEDPSVTPTPSTSSGPTATPTPTATPANPEMQLGGMNLYEFCQSLGEGESTLNGNTWTCTTGAVINLDDACAWQYNQPANARQTAQGNPYSWACFSGTSATSPIPSTSSGPTATPTLATAGERLGGMNLYDYCQTRGEGGSEWEGNTWVCSTGTAIALDQACTWQYNQPATARQETTGNPYSWACYAGASAVTPTPTITPTPSAGSTNYLSLGDSFAFGFHLAQYQQAVANDTYDPDQFNDGYDRSFYENLQGINSNIEEVNYACPGETTATFINGGCVFHNGNELHDEYATTQSQFQAAITYLSAHQNEDFVVTLDLGVNDTIELADICEAEANPQACYENRTPSVLQALQQNFGTILDSLQQASQRVQIILVKAPNPVYYKGSEAVVSGLNDILDREAIARGLPIADAYSLFTEETICSWTNYCTTPQDFHPNAAGYGAMANTIWEVSGYASN